MEILIWLATGILVGWIASKFFKTNDSLITYLVIGVVGSMIGGYLFGVLGINLGGFLGSLFTSVCGAVVLLFIVTKIKK